MPNRILVIEDDEAIRHAYENALQAAGFQTAGFGTYFAAAREIDAGAGALLLVDLILPPGTPQGLAIARMARHHRPGLPIIFVTGEPGMAALVDADTDPILEAGRPWRIGGDGERAAGFINRKPVLRSPAALDVCLTFRSKPELHVAAPGTTVLNPDAVGTFAINCRRSISSAVNSSSLATCGSPAPQQDR